MNSIRNRINKIKEKYLYEKLFVNTNVPADIVWDPFLPGYIIGHNTGLEIFTEDMVLSQNQIYKNVFFENSPIIIDREEYLLCVALRGSKIIKKISKKTGEVLSQIILDSPISHLLKLTDSKIITQPYDQENKNISLILDDNLEIIQKISFDFSLNVPMTVKNSETLLFIDNNEIENQIIKELSIKNKTIDKQVALSFFREKIGCVIHYKNLTFLCSQHYIFGLDDQYNIMFEQCFPNRLGGLKILNKNGEVSLYILRNKDKEILRHKLFPLIANTDFNKYFSQ